MRPGFFFGSSPSERPSGHRQQKSGSNRKAKLRRATLEGLEPRTLLATIPAPAVLGRANASNNSPGANDNSSESSPTIVVNPTNPNHLVASWTRFDTDPDPDLTEIQARMSTDGGLTWMTLSVPARRIDPSTGTNPAPYPTIDNASVAFGPDGSFYMLSLQHNGVTSGDLILRRYNADGSVAGTTTVYQWNRSAQDQSGATAIRLPTLAVDDTAASYTDPDNASGNVTNPHSGNVYVAYIGDTPPLQGATNWNPLTVELVRSTDQGASFSTPLVLNTGGNFGDQRNTRPRIAVSQGGGGSQPGQVTVVWDDFNSGANATPPTSIIRSRQVFNGGTTLGAEAFVAAVANVRGNDAGGGTLGGLTALGVGPQPTIAVDNTLGAFSPHRGRIYVAYTNRLDITGNPADNTEIYLAYSDNGGVSWQSAGRVNDDFADRDGFSGANGADTGRPQFLPEVAVDRATGTVVVSFYDTRHDASRVRAAMYVTASIDGGASFSEQVFVNQPEAVLDVANGQTRVVGPIPDNAPSGSSPADGTFGYGIRQGLAVLGGRVYSAWSSNLNGGLDGQDALDIQVARATIAAGPRIVEGTSGVVTTTDASGTPQAQQFVVTFDRPIDPATFSTDDVEIRARDAFGNPIGGDVLGRIPATNVTPLSATSFLVTFPAQSTPGTYSYAIGPEIRDRIRSFNTAGNAMDQSGDAVAGAADDRFSQPTPDGGLPFSGTYIRQALPLVVPGPRVVATQVVTTNGQLGSAGPNLVLNGTVAAFRVTFDRDMEPSTFTVEDVLRIIGPGGPVDPSTFTVTPIDARTFEVGFATQQLSGTYQLLLSSNIQSVGGYLVDSDQDAGVDILRGGPVETTAELAFVSRDIPVTIPASGSVESTLVVDKAFEIRDLDLQLNIAHTNVPDLTAELVAPDGTTILLFSGVGDVGDRDNFINTIFDDEATLPIQQGGPPFSSRFRPQQPLSALDNTDPSLTPGTYTLRITNAGTVAGTLNSWRLIFQEPVTGTGLGEPVADRIAADFRIFTMAEENGLSSSTWTAVGPASINGGQGSGRVTGLAVDPSDPSGNTVFVGGASGGVWKTTNFLTTDPEGPTWIPLLDRVATFGMNIGGIAVLGRNNDPNQSIVFVATGEGDVFSQGVGLLRSLDGGQSWELLDSLNNTLPFAQRGHELVGLTAFDVVVDPRPTATGEAIVYAAFSGTGANTNSGVYRSIDSGRTWQLVRAGQATDIELDPTSGPVDIFTNPTGNLQTVFASFRGEGVFISTAQGRAGSWSLMAGGVGKPTVLDLDVAPVRPVPVSNQADTPNGAKGRIVLAKPTLTGDPRQDLVYSGWLYAAVATTAGQLDGLYLTKDYGQNWTRLRIPTLPPPSNSGSIPATPTNDITQADYDPLGNSQFAQGNFNIALTVDPTNPNVVYLGGTNNGQESGLIRVDATSVNDPHAFFLNNDLPGGAVRRNYVTGAVTVEPSSPDDRRDNNPFGFDPRTSPVMNLLRDPANPLSNDVTVRVNNTGAFANSGAGVRWTPFDAVLTGTDVHRALSYVDPLTGKGRLIFGYDQGVASGVDAGDGTLLTSLGTMTVPTGSRNGNLQITQLYYGAAQPSDLTAQIAGALLYGQAQDDGFPRSDPDLLENGNINWNGPFGDGTGVATDQTGSGTAYYYNWPCCGGAITSFFRVDTPDGAPNNGVGRTTGLIQQSGGGQVPDPQWPFLGGSNFAVNPVNGQEIVMSSAVSGRVFRTLNRGLNWFPIGEPSTLGNAYFPALAFGAPATPDSEITGDYIIGGNTAGGIYVTYTGGASWIQINNGDLAGNTAPFQAIVPNPRPGTFEAYAVTSNGVYHINDTRTGSWRNITGDLFQVTHNIFGDPNFEDRLLANIKALAVDWRYVIPNDIDNPPPLSDATNPSLTHPVLYVAGEGGVLASYNDGVSWQRFPSELPNSIATTPTPPGDGGGFPVADVRDLDLALGHVDRRTGIPQTRLPGPDGTLGTSDDIISPDILVATTFGRGAYAIRLAPVVFPDSLRLVFNGQRIAPNASMPPEVGSANLVFEGISAQTASGNTVTIRAFLLDDNNQPIGGPVGTTTTNSAGRFSVSIPPSVLGADGPKRIGIQAINSSGVAGNIALFDVILDTIPPDAPTLLDLQPGSDSGSSNTDNYTNALTPGGIAAPTFDVGGVEGGVTVQLLRNGVLVASLPDAPAGTVSITDDNAGAGVPDGTHSYVVRLVDRAGNVSADSPTLEVTIDTVAPATPTTPALAPADDSGVAGDAITNVRRPRLIGSMALAANEQTPENLPFVEIVGPGDQVLGRAQVAADGSYEVQIAIDLADGVYFLQARAVDRAGNVSRTDPGLAVTIDTSLPPAASLGLSPTDDTGVPGDNVTSIRRPRLIGSSGAGLQVELIDVDGTVPGSAAPGAVVGSPVLSQVNGLYTLQFPSNLPDGTYRLLARVTNVAGNTIDSPVLVLTILNEIPTEAPTLRLAPESDTGLAGDSRTAARRPFLIGEGTPNTTIEIVGPAGQVLASGTTDAQGGYRLQLASDLTNGTIELRARLRGPSGIAGPFGAPLTLTIESVFGDSERDGRADLALYRPGTTAGGSTFLISQSSGGSRTISSADFRSSDPNSPLFNAQLRPDDIPIIGDFDGDGRADAAVFRPSSDRMPGASEWLILGSRTGPRSILFGGSGLDQPAPGDFDGDGVTDLAVFRPVSDLLPGAAEWFILPSSTGQGVRILFGGAGGLDVPAVGDFDGDGRDDIAVFRPNSDLIPGASQWFILPSGPNDVNYSQKLGGYSVLFGQAGVDQPVPLDYDGDGRDDVATFRPTTSEWFIMRSSLPTASAGLRVAFGVPGDLAAPADYDGDGIADLAAFRPSTGVWTIRRTTDSQDVVIAFGSSGDIPVLGPLAARDPRTIASSSTSGAGVGQAALQAGSTASTALDLGTQTAPTASTLNLGGLASRLSRSSSASRGRPAQAASETSSGARRLGQVRGDRPASSLRELLSGIVSRRRGGSLDA
ncbi:Ig-like domain-containing protein [Tautonia sociabilis]|uniref:P/Homo B domain-containing protein n=1 Tax=Tautonia sociabilis TaxID=2080755 RepID=A0A432MFP4_9BACT|nr:Ig-like domain-containing protein [Tautonia sociabilis]RUL84947.1 hypothetical protein TsocGM_19600 [Tautonia sociabilis]